ncbi:MAG: VWA domain-containing protein [Proteobacteria bacterium]|nr:VWA domain-containing protein [Pseudomonadota bacterium]
MRRVCRAAALSGLAALGLASEAGADDASVLELSIVFPGPDSEVAPTEPVFLAGHAFLDFAGASLDAVIVVDVSASVGMPSGEDLDRDGLLDRSFAGSDSILAAELAAASRVARELALPGNRIGLVTFSSTRSGSFALGGSPRAATLVTAPTGNSSSLRRGVETIRAQLPRGMTDTAAALGEALRALERTSRNNGRGRIVLLFSDGEPTSPHASSTLNLQAALEAAQACADRGIRVHTFAVGPEALANPEALVRIAENTRGFFTPVDRISELPDLAYRVVRGSVRALQVSNLTTGEQASDLLLGNDGYSSALVSTRPGPNVIEVSATALGGASARRELTVLARGGVVQPIPAAFETRREDLLRHRLLRLQGDTADLGDRLRRAIASRMRQSRARSDGSVRDLSIEIGSDRVGSEVDPGSK